MPHKHPTLISGLMLRRIGIVAASMALSFFFGIKTAGEGHQIIGSTMAGEAITSGDLDGNGAVDVADAHLALQISQGLAVASQRALAADPTEDFRITAEDALLILDMIAHR